MSQRSTSIARRDLFRGAAALLGGSALGLVPTLAEAAPKAAPLSLGYWNGARFVAAESLVSGDSTLDRVRLTLTSAGGGGFDALEAHAPARGRERVPFILWVSPPAGIVRSRAKVATEFDGSLVLGVNVKGEKRREVHLAAGRSAGPKLREGTYVLAPESDDWASFRLDENGQIVQRRTSTPHVVIVVERA